MQSDSKNDTSAVDGSEGCISCRIEAGPRPDVIEGEAESCCGPDRRCSCC